MNNLLSEVTMKELADRHNSHIERNRLEIEIDIQSARIDRLKENAQTAKEREYAHVGAGLDKAIKRAEEDLNELKRQLAEVMK